MFEIDKTMFENLFNQIIQVGFIHRTWDISDILALRACCPSGQYISYIPGSR